MAYCSIDGDPDPKARGPQETPDKPEPNDEVGGAAGRIKCGGEGSPTLTEEESALFFLEGWGARILGLLAENVGLSRS